MNNVLAEPVVKVKQGMEYHADEEIEKGDYEYAKHAYKHMKFKSVKKMKVTTRL